MPAALSPSAILWAWEQGSNRHGVDRALLLLWSAWPEAADIADWPLAERDRRLLALRAATFGDAMPGIVECPVCHSTQEFSLSAAALLAAEQTAPPGDAEIESLGYRIRLRELDSHALAAAACAGDVAGAMDALVEGAIDSVESPAGPVSASDLPAEVRQSVVDTLDERNAAAEINLRLTCQTCSSQFQSSFDIAGYLWLEVEAEARRLLVEVATLAARFGWSESDILAMTPTRRRAYLQLGSRE